MAKLEYQLVGNFDMILNAVDNAVRQSISATLEDSSNFYMNGARCSVRVYERYSYLGKNRVSLSFTLVECDGKINASAITSGGSQALFFKINTIGEHSFLNTIKDTLESFRGY